MADRKLTKEETYRYKEAFAIFDVRSTGAINGEELGALLAVLKISPTKAEIASAIGRYAAPNGGKIRQKDFYAIAAELSHRVDNELRVLEALENLCGIGGPSGSAVKLAELLSTKGEPFSGDELAQFMALADPNKSGTINCREVTRKLLE